MRAKAQKWGNSLAVRIPKAIADEAGLHAEDELEIDVEADAIVIKPQRRGPSLAKLLAGVTAENLHGEVDFGETQGREVW